MAHAHDLHVIPDVIGWKVATTIHARPLAITRTRDEAVALALRMEYEDLDAGEVLVHGRDGEIRERTTISRGNRFPPQH